MKNKTTTWHIKKELLNEGISVYMNNSLGTILEIKDKEIAETFVQTMNANSDSNCRYTLHKVS